MNDIKIKVKKAELEYCFKADNYDEFQRRLNQLADIMYQRFINELTIEQLKKAMVNNIYGYIDTDILTKTNKRYGIAKRGNSK